MANHDQFYANVSSIQIVSGCSLPEKHANRDAPDYDPCAKFLRSAIFDPNSIGENTDLNIRVNSNGKTSLWIDQGHLNEHPDCFWMLSTWTSCTIPQCRQVVPQYLNGQIYD